MNEFKATYSACQRYQGQTERLLALPADRLQRMMWLEHSKECIACRQVIAVDNELKRLIQVLPEPHPAFITGAVMSRIRSDRRRSLFSRRGLVWALGSSLAGVVLGLGLTAVLPQNTLITASNGSEFYIAEFDDGLDDFYAALMGDDGENGR
ncbi:MAG: hypothetical protein FJY65_03615 [Calditrichaeota bacterium]|nr:hypothetical protein [Calditrichota bacterium]